MNDEERTRTLLIEAHRAIANASSEAVSKIGVSLRRKVAVDSLDVSGLDPKIMAALADAISTMTLNYPPEKQTLTPSEERALRTMKLTPAAKSALRKLIAEACHSTMFHFLCLMDAVAGPSVVPSKKWFGARFAARKEGAMLHDEFGDLYWEYQDALTRRPRRSSKRSVRWRPKAT